MSRKIYDLKNKRAALLDEAEAALNKGDKASMDAKMTEAKALAEDIQAMEALSAARGDFKPDDAKMVNLAAAQQTKREEDETMGRVEAVCAGREYAKAFCYAIRNGLNPKNGKGVEALAPLYAALTEGGGPTPGEDGGFLVPVDMSTKINEFSRQLIQLSTYFSVETVSAPTGWRVLDTRPTAGFTPLDEMEEIPQDDQPAFSRMRYTVKKYGLIVPVSNELVSDNDAGLLNYLARWFARKGVLTDNKLLLATLNTLAATDLVAGEEIAGIKTALNKRLDPNISINATILTNQSGYDKFDSLEDSNHRPLLQPDPSNTTGRMLKGRPVVVMSDATLPNAADKAPVYIGDFRQYATLFQRLPLEIRSTDIGGKAWMTDSVEVRGIKRLCVETWDTEAAVKLQLDV